MRRQGVGPKVVRFFRRAGVYPTVFKDFHQKLGLCMSFISLKYFRGTHGYPSIVLRKEAACRAAQWPVVSVDAPAVFQNCLVSVKAWSGACFLKESHKNGSRMDLRPPEIHGLREFIDSQPCS